jgi:hypothetical protein
MKKFPVHFSGISVFMPDEDMIAIDREIPDRKIIMGTPGVKVDFTPIRIVGNICLYRKDDLNTPLQEFKPPLEFRVQYNFFDLIQCNGDINNLKLAYWDGRDWVVVSIDKHDYQILPPSTAQLAEFKIFDWVGDPAIAWGR